ncbi:MAG: hypothetical protein IH840_03540 [Candidatus Heimdallarchaeota archaeon]|nr:hypothetical protein [Candidatus Heimdallarchaeota archaeon]
MKEYYAYAILLGLSFITGLLDIRILGFVIYDKILHFGIGSFFMIYYSKLNPGDNYYIVASIFTFLYEIFIYIIFPIPIVFLLNQTNLTELPSYVLGNFFPKYTQIDEWLDVVVTWLGCVLVGYILQRNSLEVKGSSLIFNE